MEEIVDIVDENDNAVGKATRKEAHEKNLLHRLVHVVVENSKGEILVLKREKNVEVWPSWLSNVGGHVEAGENYESAAERELNEELGIKARREFFGTVKVTDSRYSHVVGCFKVKANGPFTPDKSEIEKIEFKTLEKIREEIGKVAKYTPTFKAVISRIYGQGEIVDLINENDEVIGQATREEVKKGKLLYRCAGIYVKKNGRVLIEKRGKQKSIRPGNWSIVEETLHSGETYEQAARRGVREELGLEAENLKFIGKKMIDDSVYPDRFLLGIFTCEAEGKIKLQESEVEKAQWVSRKQLQSIIKRTKKVSPGLSQTHGMYLEAGK